MTKEELTQEYLEVSRAWNGLGYMSTGEAITRLTTILASKATSVALRERTAVLLENIVRGRYRIERDKVRHG